MRYSILAAVSIGKIRILAPKWLAMLSKISLHAAQVHPYHS